MLTRFQNLATAAATALVSAVVVNAAPAQAFTLSFTGQFDEGVLFGFFTGTDANRNGVIEGAEFTDFSSTFLNQPFLPDVEPLPEFETSTSWGLSDLLASGSRYVSNSDFSFFLVNSELKAWESFSNPDLDFGISAIGTVTSRDPAAVLNGFTFSSQPVAFDRAEAVPEPMTVAGLALAGAGMAAARRRQQGTVK